MARIITYECEQCGHQLVSLPTGETVLEPIYCCGIEVSEISAVSEKQAKPKKTAVKKPAKKAVKVVKRKTEKKTLQKKKPAARKKAAKK